MCECVGGGGGGGWVKGKGKKEMAALASQIQISHPTCRNSDLPVTLSFMMSGGGEEGKPDG